MNDSDNFDLDYVKESDSSDQSSGFRDHDEAEYSNFESVAFENDNSGILKIELLYHSTSHREDENILAYLDDKNISLISDYSGPMRISP